MSLARNGYAITDLVLTASACEAIASELPEIGKRQGGVRNILTAPAVLRLIRDPRFAAEIERYADAPLVAVKAILFDKTAEANWRVQWHQDRVIAVRERRDVPEFGPWTIKDGVPHVEPPAHVLASMVAARVHLDDSTTDNGPLRVIPGSHRHGKLPAETMRAMVETGPQVELAVPQGSVLLMRPLLVHASAPSLRPAHRRVLHIELAPPELPAPLEWQNREWLHKVIC